MEAERRHAYATRLQCWWRCILAVKVKLRRLLALKETPLEDVEEEAEKAALVLQVHTYGLERLTCRNLRLFPLRMPKTCAAPLEEKVEQRSTRYMGCLSCADTPFPCRNPSVDQSNKIASTTVVVPAVFFQAVAVYCSRYGYCNT